MEKSLFLNKFNQLLPNILLYLTYQITHINLNLTRDLLKATQKRGY